ncbi:MAG: hypothetical protein Q9163_003982 [Psora crenata]
MADINLQSQSWNTVANDVALDNLNRFLAGTDQMQNSTRPHCVSRESAGVGGQITKPVAVAEWSKSPKNSHGPLIGAISVVSARSSSPMDYATAYSKHAASGQSQASTSTTSNNNEPFMPMAPHLRASSSTTGSYYSLKNGSTALIDVDLDTHLSEVGSTKPSTKGTYKEHVAAQTRYATPTRELPSQPTPKWPASKPSVSSTGHIPKLPDQWRRPKQAFNDDEPIENTSKPLNSGTAAKSAKVNAKYPCSYDDCSMGFASKNDLNKHKYTEHEGWCKTCDIDTEDDKALLAHKMSSLKHICCQFCGKDFHSEAARNAHEERDHALKRNVNNKCRDPRGQVREKTIREHRVMAALSLDRLAHASSAPKAWETQTGSIADDSSVGGVPIQGCLLDSDIPSRNLKVPQRSLLDDTSSVSDGYDDAASTTTANSDRTILDTDEFPSLRARQNLGSKASGRIIEGLASLDIGNSVHQRPTTKTMAKILFGDAKTPAACSTSITTNPEGRRAYSYSASQVFRTEKKSDWDHLQFEKDDITGDWKCPFETCGVLSKEIQPLIEHLQSGYHYGTDNQCVKCLKKFQEVHQLIAHMESDSIRCGIKWTHRYGHIIHILSGGFLGVVRDENDRPYIKEVDEPEPAAPVLADDDDYRDPYYTSW